MTDNKKETVYTYLFNFENGFDFPGYIASYFGKI